MKEGPKKILVAAAWPYANGSLHLGHIASLIGGDVLARYHRSKQDAVLFVSGSDCYGTPITLEALARKVTPASIAEKYHEEFSKNFVDDLSFSYDVYSRTTDRRHEKLVHEIFLRLYEKGHVYRKKTREFFSEGLGKFLPDRFVEGECPECGYASARGDQCDGCGKLVEALELKNPRLNPKTFPPGTVSDASIVPKDSEQFYLKLSSFQEDLERWVEQVAAHWRVNAREFTKSFLRQGLHDRAITRNTDWGVSVPLEGFSDKRIYVWFEAVLGYLSASRQAAEEKGERWEDWWRNDDALHYYVHGKDNIPFHTIILPAMLLGYDRLHLPDKVFSAEYLMLEGEQFSTSRNHALWVSDFVKQFDSELLRYFLIVQGTESGDSDFRLDAFKKMVNGELIGTFGNLVHRVFLFVEKNFSEGVSEKKEISEESTVLLNFAEGKVSAVGEHIEQGSFRKAFREIISLAEQCNQYMHKREPWKRIENDRDSAETDLFVLVRCIHILSVLVFPFLPKTSAAIRKFLGFAPNIESLADSSYVVWEIPRHEERYAVSGVAPLFRKIETTAEMPAAE